MMQMSQMHYLPVAPGFFAILAAKRTRPMIGSSGRVSVTNCKRNTVLQVVYASTLFSDRRRRRDLEHELCPVAGKSVPCRANTRCSRRSEQLRQLADVRRDASGLVVSEQLGRRATVQLPPRSRT